MTDGEKIERTLARFFDDLHRRLAEIDILDPEMPIDVVLDKNFECPTPEVREKIRDAIVDWRKSGKVNWRLKI